jgi:hypothetical protein
MQVIGLLFYLFSAIDFLLWLLFNINLTHTSWSPLAACLIGRACIAFGAVNTATPRRVSKPAPEGIEILDRAPGAQTQVDADFTVAQAVTSAV